MKRTVRHTISSQFVRDIDQLAGCTLEAVDAMEQDTRIGAKLRPQTAALIPTAIEAICRYAQSIGANASALDEYRAVINDEAARLRFFRLLVDLWGYLEASHGIDEFAEAILAEAFDANAKKAKDAAK